MHWSLKLLALSLLVFVTLSVTGCSATQSPALPQAPLVVKEAEIPPLPEMLKKEPPPSGAFLQRAEQREEAMRQSLKTSPPR